MRKILPFILIFSFIVPSHSAEKSDSEYIKFFITEAKKDEGRYRYNKYEDIISGSLAFLIGNIGFFTTNSKVLSLGYSGIQTIGIFNVGDGIYDLYRPNQEKSFYHLLSPPKGTKITKSGITKEFIHIFAQEERAKRLSLLYTSLMLSSQYFINATLGDVPDDLKSVYLFLGGVNVIVVGYAYFYRSKYEQFFYTSLGDNSFLHAGILSPSTDRYVPGIIFTSSF